MEDGTKKKPGIPRLFLPSWSRVNPALFLNYWAQYKHLWQRERIPAKTLLLEEGSVCQKLYLIRRGCIRAFFESRDKEICFQFFFEKDIVYAPESLRLGTPSPFSLETIEPCVLYSIRNEGLAILREALRPRGEGADDRSAGYGEDGAKTVTLKGDRIAEEFQELVEQYIARTYARRTEDAAGKA